MDIESALIRLGRARQLAAELGADYRHIDSLPTLVGSLRQPHENPSDHRHRCGDPTTWTVQAINALNRTDVFFLMDKAAPKTALIGLRKTICERLSRAATTALPAPSARAGA